MLVIDLDTKKWQDVQPMAWKEEHVMSWVLHLVDEFDMDISDMSLSLFKDINGEKMANMSKDNFEKLHYKYGSVWHREFRKLLAQKRIGKILFNTTISGGKS